MGWRVIGLIAAVLVLSFSAAGQSHEWVLALVGRGNFTTTSRIYPNPDAPSTELRTINTPFNSVLNGGVEVRAKWRDDNFFFYFSTEYFSESSTELKLYGSPSLPIRVPVEDGYRVIPFELGMQVYVPIGSRSWKLSMGGGAGGYYAERILQVAGVRAGPVGNRLGFGIHVSIHTEYNIVPGISAIAMVKFRDPEIDVNNKFESSTTVFNGNVLPLPPGDIHSRVNVDGMTIGLGIVVEIF